MLGEYWEVEQEDAGDNGCLEKMKKAVRQKELNVLNEMCKHCCEVEAGSFLELFDDATEDAMETMVPALYALAARGWSYINHRAEITVMDVGNLDSEAEFLIPSESFFKTQIEGTVYRFMCCSRKSRFARKAALSALRVIKTGSVWDDYFALANTLEEPQFHLIEPALPYFDRLLNICDTADVSWHWVQILFVRALNHSNGWIRVWAVEKVLSVDVKLLRMDYSLILETVFTALNGNDIYWRLIEGEKLDIFIENFGSFLQRISCILSSSEATNFFKTLLRIISACISSSSSMFFISRSLQYVEPTPLFNNINSDAFELYRQLLSTIGRMPYLPLRICTTANFVKFFTKLAHKSTAEINSLASVLSNLSEKNYEFLIREFQNTQYTEREKRSSPDVLARWMITCYKSDCIEGSNWCCCTFCVQKMMQEYGCEPELITGILSSFYSLVSIGISNEADIMQADCLMYLYIGIYEDERLTTTYIHPLFETGLFVDFESVVNKYLDVCFFGVTNKAFDPIRFNAVQKKLIIKYGKNFEEWLLRSVQMYNKTETLSMRAALSSVAATVITKCQKLSSVVWNAVFECLLSKESDYLESNVNKKELIVHKETIVKNKAILWQRFIDENPFDSALLFDFCIASLKLFFSWDCRHTVLDLLVALMKETPDQMMVEKSINAVMAVAVEEKKSRNHILVIEKLVEICASEFILSTVGADRFAKETFEKLYAESEQNVQIAVVLSDALYNARSMLDHTWFQLLIRMCAFGPIYKKDMIVLSSAFEMAYKTETYPLPSAKYEKIHECAQYARLRALQTASLICQRSPELAHHLVYAAVDRALFLDMSNNRSFARSIVHREKTRLVQLLLLIHGFLKKVALKKVELLCLNFLYSSQQPSVRLIVEWILIRLYWQDERAFQEFVTSEKELAKRRIGSICSWITILMHIAKISRSNPAVMQCFTLFLPWCTAQNFAVRCTALAALRQLWKIAGNEVREQLDHVHTVITFDAKETGNAKRIIDNLCDDFYFVHLNGNTDFTLETILTVIPEKTGLAEQDIISRDVLESISEQDFCCVRYNSHDLSKYISVAFGQIQQPRQQQIRELELVADVAPIVQRKYNAASVNRTHPDEVSLIVVASLLDKAANLGGICRTCEVLGVDKLIVADLVKVRDRDFIALSMSSENWITVEQVRPEDLPDFLQSLRECGYVIIGAEQTTNSTPLNRFHLPPKMALLLGNEKEGIPMNLLGYIDEAVEVPQVGRTKSLNAHVAGALFIYKFFEKFFV